MLQQGPDQSGPYALATMGGLDLDLVQEELWPQGPKLGKDGAPEETHRSPAHGGEDDDITGITEIGSGSPGGTLDVQGSLGAAELRELARLEPVRPQRPPNGSDYRATGWALHHS